MREFSYTIIVPHYKIIDLLKRCLKSIPDREDIQIVVVDDNSGIDESLFNNICKFGKATCDFIFNKKSKGAGGARNKGLEIAKGKWILFADADDFFAQIAFEKFDEYLESKYDIVYFNTKSVYSETLKPSPRNKIYTSYIDICDNESEDKINLVKFGHTVPYAKMIRKSIIKDNDIHFDETKYCNDTMFSLNTALNADSVYIDNSNVYYVTNREGSLVTEMTEEAMLIRYEVILRANQLLRIKSYDKYQNTILFYLKKAFGFGIITLYKALKLGVKYDAYNVYSMYKTSRRVKLILSGKYR